MRISRAVASMSASVSRPLPRRPVKTLSQAVGEGLEHSTSSAVTGGDARPRHGCTAQGLGAAQAARRARVQDQRRTARRRRGRDGTTGTAPTSCGAGPLRALAAVVGVAVGARRLDELAVVGTGRAGRAARSTTAACSLGAVVRSVRNAVATATDRTGPARDVRSRPRTRAGLPAPGAPPVAAATSACSTPLPLRRRRPAVPSGLHT